MAPTVQVVLDCADPGAQAQFWAAALGYVVQPPPPGHETWPDFLRELGVPEEQWNDRSAVVDPDGLRPRVFLQKVPEPKTVKNRVHLDVQVGAGLGPDERPGRVAGGRAAARARRHPPADVRRDGRALGRAAGPGG